MPQTRFAQTVCHFSHNADFDQLRISKYPANAHEINYFYTLCTGRNYSCPTGRKDNCKKGEKMKKYDFMQKNACNLEIAVILYRPNA